MVKVISAQLVVDDEAVIVVASHLREMVDTRLVAGADVVVYGVEQQPDLMTGNMKFEDRTEQ